ncbi:C-GCAxxG-C-C family protein [Fibrobacter sp.]|uniref:C-GCAxxG-C-C family protein n=1 Tax=Fibrobacter sp. TaxID=35828 RepID=UPI0026126F47|nr:C-GCAxxG-C-C family protein [Fibrobacter sp.]MDD5941066.1 C-GCAxxG-C-C family protein [Fibrobacter sp.]
MTRKEKAMAYFRQGYNCAQAVVLAFADLTDMDEATLSRMSCSFGGGMGRLREVCGTVTGMFLVTGLLRGYDGAETGEVKAAHYARIQALAKEFERQNGSIVCRELLALRQKHRDDPTPEARTEAYYAGRPCVELVGSAAEILENYLAIDSGENGR